MGPQRYNHLKALFANISSNINIIRHIGIDQLKNTKSKKVIGQLVLLGYDITAFTPTAYQRCSLQRPSMEILS